MKLQLVWWIGLLLVCLTAMPVLAQRQDPAMAKSVTGKILTVDVAKGEFTVGYLIQVDNPDAPGKMPDDMAQQATTLADQAAQLDAQVAQMEERATSLEQAGATERAKRTRAEQQDRMKRAAQVRQQVEQCRRWRLTERVVTATTPIFGNDRLTLAQVPVGTRLMMMVSVEGTVADSTTLPTTVTLNSDPTEAGKTTAPPFRQFPVVKGTGKTFYTLTGTVVTADPLVLDVNGNHIQIDNPAHRVFLKQKRLTCAELQPGWRVFSRVQLNATFEIQAVLHIMVAPNNNENHAELKELPPQT
ncbi:MAG TPA: hypothetical protein VGL77_14950 [Armatimonadota bacterium]|jgi:hypothetical protein